jgi:hypothetical protein
MPPLKHQAWNQLAMHQEWNQLAMIPSFFNLLSLPSCNEYRWQGRSRLTGEAVEADQLVGRRGQTTTQAYASISRQAAAGEGRGRWLGHALPGCARPAGQSGVGYGRCVEEDGGPGRRTGRQGRTTARVRRRAAAEEDIAESGGRCAEVEPNELEPM